MYRHTTLPWNIIITLAGQISALAVPRRDFTRPEDLALAENVAQWLIHTLVGWVISAVALYIVAHIVNGIDVRDFGAALIATVIIAIVNNTIGPILRLLALPLTFLTFGLFLLVINAVLLKLASLFTPGFRVSGFGAALLGSLALTVITAILRFLV
jgi:putative membrane protein